MAATGCRTISRISQTSNRASCTTAMIAAGVRYTGARQTGTANGSGLVQLGHLLTGHHLAHTLVTSSLP